jgi:predicted nucleic acid-binding protein
VILYVDSSALIKYYIQESGSRSLMGKIKEESFRENGIFMSVVGYAEVLAVLARHLRENLLSAAEFATVENQFSDDWMFHLGRIELSVGVLGFIPELVRKHPLRGFDATHLASALWIRDALRLGKSVAATRPVTFATSDKQLRRAAAAEGLDTFDPEDAG